MAFRRPIISDRSELARLMIDAYTGTIDYDGETVEDALKEVDGYFAGKSGLPLLAASWICLQESEMAGALLVSIWQDAPLIAYVMTAAAVKSQGLASAMLARSLADLTVQGYREVVAFITEGNLPSEALFRRAGFVS